MPCHDAFSFGSLHWIQLSGSVHICTVVCMCVCVGWGGGGGGGGGGPHGGGVASFPGPHVTVDITDFGCGSRVHNNQNSECATATWLHCHHLASTM